MKISLLNRNVMFLLIGLFLVSTNPVFSQLPASLEKEILQFNADIYEALEIISTASETDAVSKLSVIKPELMSKATSLSARLNEIPDFSPAEEEAWTRKMMETQVFQDLMALLSDQSFLAKIQSSQVLQGEFEELMSITDLGFGANEEESELPGSQVCSFAIGSGSPLSGSYVVIAAEDQAFAYDDDENDQFVIEIHGDNYIDVMLIIEDPVRGKHTFTMEMQVAIDLSTNEGEDYFSFDNHLEEGGGYIQIDRMGGSGEMVSGSFRGKFNDNSSGDDRVVDIEGRFSVRHE